MILLKFIPNILKDEGREIYPCDFDRDKTLRQYLESKNLIKKDTRVIVTGNRVTDFDTRLNNGDEVIVTPDVKDPVSFVIAIVAAVWAAALAHPFIAWAMAPD